MKNVMKSLDNLILEPSVISKNDAVRRWHRGVERMGENWDDRGFGKTE